MDSRDGAAYAAHLARKRQEEERKQAEERRELEREQYEEEESLTPYTEDDLAQDWQFKIVEGDFETAESVQAVIQEQAAWGWVFVEKFDEERIRFKRPASEVAKDATRSGDPYATMSEAAPFSPPATSGCAGCAMFLAVGSLGAAGLGWFIGAVS